MRASACAVADFIGSPAQAYDNNIVCEMLSALEEKGTGFLLASLNPSKLKGKPFRLPA